MEKGRQVAYLKGLVLGVSTSIKMADQNKKRLFDACERGDVDTVRRIVGTDPNSGCIHSLDWTTGLDYWTGLLDWTTHAQYSAANVT